MIEFLSTVPPFQPHDSAPLEPFVTCFPRLMAMAYRCPAHRSLFRVNLFLFFAPRLFSMPGFSPLCTYSPSMSFYSVCGLLWLALLRSDSWKSPRCVSNSRVNLFSALRPRLFFRALILFPWFPGDFPCPVGSLHAPYCQIV